MDEIVGVLDTSQEAAAGREERLSILEAGSEELEGRTREAEAQLTLASITLNSIAEALAEIREFDDTIDGRLAFLEERDRELEAITMELDAQLRQASAAMASVDATLKEVHQDANEKGERLLSVDNQIEDLDARTGKVETQLRQALATLDSITELRRQGQEALVEGDERLALLKERARQVEERVGELRIELAGASEGLGEVASTMEAVHQAAGEGDDLLVALEGRIRAVEGILVRTADTLSQKPTEFRPLPETTSDRTITWLHFSDLHLCQARHGWDAHEIIVSLRKDLLQMQGQGLHPDMVFFTGDSAFGDLEDAPITSQFDEAIRLFQEILQAFSPAVPTENLFLVPGNHDVNRSAILKYFQKGLNSSLAEDPHGTGLERVYEMLQQCDTEWQQCMRRLQDYKDFLERAEYHHLLSDPERLIYGCVRDISGVRVGIAGLNSVWSSARDGERARLWMGGHWQIQSCERSIADAEVKIALVHHPLDWLVQAEYPALRPEIERTFHFLLHGHEHQGWVAPHGGYHVRIGAGASYGSLPDESGYNLVQLNVDQGTGEVWLRRYPKEGGGWVPRAIPPMANDQGMWPLENLRFTTTSD